MLTRRLFLSSSIFLFLFILQESLFNLVRLPIGGFSLFLIFTMCWAALSTPEVGALTGFGAGLLLDLAPANEGPIGQWTLILIGVGYGIAFLRYGDDSLRGSPFSLVVLVASGVVVTLGAYLASGVLLGYLKLVKLYEPEIEFKFDCCSSIYSLPYGCLIRSLVLSTSRSRPKISRCSVEYSEPRYS